MQWTKQARKLGLKFCYVKIGDEESGAMRKNEKTKTAEVLGQKGRKNYEQNLEHISRRSKKEVGENRSEHIRESKLYETLQDAITVQVNNTQEIGR